MATYHDPYLFLELEEASGDWSGNPAGSEQNPLAIFHDPYVFEDAISEKDKSLTLAETATKNRRATNDESIILDSELPDLLNEVLRLYRPFVARNQWEKVLEYRAEFLREGCCELNRSRKVADGLRRLKFQLMPGEKVEFNRAPAERIIGELKRLLS